MSSTNKTENLGLNNWLGSDIPQRADFNNDNNLIDTAITEHIENTINHITDTERDIWNNPYYIGVYYGNGTTSQTIELECPFLPEFGIIYGGIDAPATTNFDSKINTNHITFITQAQCSYGATLRNKTLKVLQSATAGYKNEYAGMNENGTTYFYILFR